jgi:sigma-54 dependent transcriptional regulator, acetoin dehydrogenase operon transcriptional activator AcoR
MTERDDALEAALWRDTADLATGQPPREDALSVLASRLCERLEAGSCTVYLLDRRTEDLVAAASAGDVSGTDSCVRLGQGITGLAAYQHRAIQTSPGDQDPPPSWPSWCRAVISVPVYDGDELLGVVALRRGLPVSLSAPQIASLQRVVPRLVSLLVRGAGLREALERRTDELQALNELGQAMNAGLGLDETLELIAARAVETLGAVGAAVRLVVEDGSLALATVFTAGAARFDTDSERRVASYVAETGEPVVMDEVHVQENPAQAGTSMVCVPLVLEERVVGTLSLRSRTDPALTQRRRFRLDDLDVLFALSSQIAAEIEDIRLTVRLQELVRTEKQQGQALRVLYNRSQALLQSISDGLIAIARDGTIEEMNGVAARILGMEPGLARGRRVETLVEDKPPLASWVAAGGQFTNRVVTLRAASGRVAAMANLQPVMDAGRAEGAVLTVREMREVGRFVTRMIGAQRSFTFADIIGSSAAIEKTRELARIAAGTGSNILIQGETGTGKEVVAQSIHNASSFSEGPFLAVNCAALPRDLIESELFGYVEGAFTGASRGGHLGKFELASGGTLFLDEIGDVPPDVQAKLLRVLQEKAIVRVGGDRTIPVNCRMIAATNRNLGEAVSQQRFRQDLLYRLNVITIDVPPLRDRAQDVPLFVTHFLKVCAERSGKVIDGITPAAERLLNAYPWPGNVRELENALEHGVAVARGRHVDVDDLPDQLQERHRRPLLAEAEPRSLTEARRDHEAATRNLYLAALRAEGGDILGAAQLLGVSRATMYRKVKQHRLGESVSSARLSRNNGTVA